MNVGGTQLVLDRARRVGAARFVHVSSNSPFGANRTSDDRFDEDSPFAPYMAYGRSKLEAEQLVQRSYDRGDLATVIVRPPWFYGPFQPERQTQFLAAVRRGRFPLVGPGTQRRSMVYTGNLVQGVLLAEVVDAAPGHAYWIADAEPYALRDVLRTVRDAIEAEGLSVSNRRPLPIPRIAGVVAEKLDAVAQAAGATCRSCTSRRVEGHDRVRHLGRARSSDTSRPSRCSTACGRACAGVSRAVTGSDGSLAPGDRRQRLLRHRAGRAGPGPRRCGSDLRREPARSEAQEGDVEFVRGDVRNRPWRACEGVDVVFHNVAQVPLAKDRALFDAVNVGGTLIATPARHGRSARSCTRRRARCSASPSTIPSPRTRRAVRWRRTAGPSCGPSSCVTTRSRPGSTSRSSGPARSSVTVASA